MNLNIIEQYNDFDSRCYQYPYDNRHMKYRAPQKKLISHKYIMSTVDSDGNPIRHVILANSRFNAISKATEICMTNRYSRTTLQLRKL